MFITCCCVGVHGLCVDLTAAGGLRGPCLACPENTVTINPGATKCGEQLQLLAAAAHGCGADALLVCSQVKSVDSTQQLSQGSHGQHLHGTFTLCCKQLPAHCTQLYLQKHTSSPTKYVPRPPRLAHCRLLPAQVASQAQAPSPSVRGPASPAPTAPTPRGAVWPPASCAQAVASWSHHPTPHVSASAHASQVGGAATEPRCPLYHFRGEGNDLQHCIKCWLGSWLLEVFRHPAVAAGDSHWHHGCSRQQLGQLSSR